MNGLEIPTTNMMQWLRMPSFYHILQAKFWPDTRRCLKGSWSILRYSVPAHPWSYPGRSFKSLSKHGFWAWPLSCFQIPLSILGSVFHWALAGTQSFLLKSSFSIYRSLPGSCLTPPYNCIVYAFWQHKTACWSWEGLEKSLNLITSFQRCGSQELKQILPLTC